MSIVPTAQVTLYAHWKANTYAIRFNVNGGKGSTGDLPMTYDVPSTLPTCSFVRDGYAFAGWATSANGSATYLDGASVKNVSSVNGATVSLFAVWSPIVPSAPTSVSASNRTTTEGIVLTWNAVDGATEYRVYRAEMSVSESAALVGSTSDTTWLDTDCALGKTYYYWISSYRADNNQEGGFGSTVWGRRRYADIVCTFNGNGGTATSSARQYAPEFAFGDLPSASRAGYTLSGWFTDPLNGTEVSTSSLVPTSALTLYAHWTPNRYRIHFEPNGGSGVQSDQVVTYDQETQLSANRFYRSAYTFAGWALRADGDLVYENEATVKNLSTESDAVVRMFALWRPIPPEVVTNVQASNRTSTGGIVVSWSAVQDATEYRLYRDENGASEDPQLIASLAGTSYFDTACVVGKTYYYWVKAYRADNGSISVAMSSPAAEGHRKYADITVSFNGNGGTPDQSALPFAPEFAYGDLPSARRTGYAFAGWYTSAEGGEAVDGVTSVPVADTTLHAHWTANTYFIRYDANEGSGAMDDTEMTYDVEKNLTANAFARTHYTFAGWSTNVNGNVVYSDGNKIKNLTVEQAAVVALYAVWSPVVPKSPSGVEVGRCASTTEISVAWSSVEAATEYKVWRAETEDFESAQLVGITELTSFVDSAAQPGKMYYYWIQSSNPAAVGGVSVAMPGALKLAKPENVSATCATYTNKVVVSWSAVDGATGYEVYRSETNDFSTAVKLDHIVESAFTDEDVEPEVRYHYWIKAQCSVPDADSDLCGSVVGYALKALVSLAIEGPTEIDAESQTMYSAQAHYSDGSSETVVPIWIIKDGLNFAAIASDGKLTVSTSQVDRVVVIQASFTKNGKAITEKTVLVHKVIPLPVALDNENLDFVTGGDAQWKWVEDLAFVNSYATRSGEIADGQSSWIETTVEGPCVVSFSWRVSSAAGDKLALSVDGINIDQIEGISDSALVPKTFVVEQYGSHAIRWTYVKDGTSVSGCDCGWIDNVQSSRIYPPSAVTGVSASYGTSVDGVSVSWPAVAGATSYEVWRGMSDNVTSATRLAVTSDFSFWDASATPGVAYVYWLVAVNCAGSSGMSVPVSGLRKLSAPLGLATSQSTGGVAISWESVYGATGYRVYRSDNAASPIADVNWTATSYFDGSGVPARNYSYWVVAYSSADNSAGSYAVGSYRLLAPPTFGMLAVFGSFQMWSATTPGAVNVTIEYQNGATFGARLPYTCGTDSGGFNHFPGTPTTYFAVAHGENGSTSESSIWLP